MKRIFAWILVVLFCSPVVFDWDAYNENPESYIAVELSAHQDKGEGEAEYYDGKSKIIDGHEMFQQEKQNGSISEK